jgi:AcrR family transcriptional regulator
MTYHHGDLRAALIAGALALIREVGADGFTLREVARRAGVSHAAPYRHFRDKADLAAAIAQEGFEGLARAMEEAAESEGSARDRLLRAGRNYVEVALRRPEHFRVMFGAELDAKRHPDARKAADRAFAGLVRLIEDARLGGEPLTLARIAWSQVHGIATLAIGKQFAFRTKAEVLAFTEVAMRAVVDGIGKG